VPAHPVPILYANPLVGKADSGTMTDRVPVSEALKLVTPFKGDKQEVMEFVANVDNESEVIDHSKADRISGEPRIAITHRNLENWEELKAFLRNIQKRGHSIIMSLNSLAQGRVKARACRTGYRRSTD
jgi:hypothetical protein